MSALDGWIDICRVGNWRDTHGRDAHVTESTLDALVTSFASQDPVPVVVGHPATDAPAYGWIAELRRVGDRLQARLRDLVPAFRAAVERGQYAGRSIKFGPGGLRHLAFLGGRAPAVPGLAPTQFAAAHAADPSITFAAADGDVTALADFAAPELHAQTIALAEREARLAARERHERASNIVMPHVKAGRVLPRDQDMLIRLAERHLDDEEVITFAGAGDDEVTEPPSAAFNRFLAGLPVQARYGELAGGPVPPPPNDTALAERAADIIADARSRGESMSPQRALALAAEQETP